MFIVRPAQLEDVSSIHLLIGQLAEYEQAPQEFIATESMLHHALFSENPVAIAWVAEVNGIVCGMSICYLRYSTWKGITLYLEDLVVEESMRGQGIGRALLEACIQFAKEKQYKRLVWQVLDWNTPAIEFYKKFNANFDEGWVNVWVDV